MELPTEYRGNKKSPVVFVAKNGVSAYLIRDFLNNGIANIVGVGLVAVVTMKFVRGL